MTVEELLVKFQEDISWLGYCEREREIIAHIKCAMALLKEREPTLVEIDGQFGGIKYGRCPKCGKGLNEEVYPHWCGFCGSEVKWK